MRILLRFVISCVLLSIIMPGISAAGEGAGKKILLLPHVEENEDFFTGLALLNTGKEVVDVTVSAYSSGGRIIDDKTLTMEQGERFLASVADIFGYETASKTGWLRIEHSGEIEGFGLLGNDRQLTRLPLESMPRKNLILPYALSGDGIFTELFIVNAGQDLAFLTITLYERDGTVVGSFPVETPLVGGQKLTGSLSGLFGREAAARASYLRVDTNGLIIGLGLVGNPEMLIAVPMN